MRKRVRQRMAMRLADRIQSNSALADRLEERFKTSQDVAFLSEEFDRILTDEERAWLEEGMKAPYRAVDGGPPTAEEREEVEKSGSWIFILTTILPIVIEILLKLWLKEQSESAPGA